MRISAHFIGMEKFYYALIIRGNYSQKTHRIWAPIQPDFRLCTRITPLVLRTLGAEHLKEPNTPESIWFPYHYQLSSYA
jgi:hypothetical protein